ncbi:DUF998 domain-containing protein [Virgisporangium aurantiacum]|uniref:DUF998 domain-containing protein n=1 Tax=Virgisporangium aurantiacum TaxID=175570 RepID=UPI00357156DD
MHLGGRTSPDHEADRASGQAAASWRSVHVGWRRDAERLAGTIAVLSLATAAPLAAASGAVPCTSGCPLPPYERASHQDIAHAVTSIGGFGCAAVAMIVLAWLLPSLNSPTPVTSTISGSSGISAISGTPPASTDSGENAPDLTRLRRVSRFGAGLVVPLLVAAGLAMLVVGRGLLAGTLERAALAASLGWLVAAAVTMATTRPAAAGSADGSVVAIRRRT